MNRTEQRNLPVDCAKSLAISFVLLIHASADILRGGAVGSGYRLEGLFWNSLSRGAVPLFLLCSCGLSAGLCRQIVSLPLLAALCGAGSFLIWLLLSRLPWVRRWLV